MPRHGEARPQPARCSEEFGQGRRSVPIIAARGYVCRSACERASDTDRVISRNDPRMKTERKKRTEHYPMRRETRGITSRQAFRPHYGGMRAASTKSYPVDVNPSAESACAFFFFFSIGRRTGGREGGRDGEERQGDSRNRGEENRTENLLASRSA